MQRLLQNPDWAILQEVQEAYMKNSFLHASFKKDTEFDTIWYAAFSEGGKHYLQDFFQHLDKLAESANE